MYKNTTRSLTFHGRVASDSTKGYGTGLVETLPPEAQPWEQVFLTLREQLTVVIEKLDKTRERMRSIDNQLDSGMSPAHLAHLGRLRQSILRESQHYDQLRASLKESCKQAAENSFAYSFLVTAGAMLTDELYQQLETEARAIHGPDRKLPHTEEQPASGLTRTQKTKSEKRRRMLLRPNSVAATKDRERLEKYAGHVEFNRLPGKHLNKRVR